MIDLVAVEPTPIDLATPLTPDLRTRLRAAIPDPTTLLPPPTERDRWREVLIEEVNRLASARYPQESVELLVQSGAAYWSEQILVAGTQDGKTCWTIRMPMARRLLPRAGFAHMFVEGAPPSLGGARLDVPEGHRVKGLYDGWAAADATRRKQETAVRESFLGLIDVAQTLGDVLDAWPLAAAVLLGPTTDATRLGAAQDAVRSLLDATKPVPAQSPNSEETP